MEQDLNNVKLSDMEKLPAAATEVAYNALLG